MGVPPMGAGERTRMSDGRRVGGIRTKQKAFDGQPSGPLVPRTGWSGAFDRFRNLTTSSPPRFAVSVFQHRLHPCVTEQAACSLRVDPSATLDLGCALGSDQAAELSVNDDGRTIRVGVGRDPI